MKRTFGPCLRALLAAGWLILAAGCGESASAPGKATVTESPKTHKTHSPPPVSQPRTR